jgi:hypothetical protein
MYKSVRTLKSLKVEIGRWNSSYSDLPLVAVRFRETTTGTYCGPNWVHVGGWNDLRCPSIRISIIRSTGAEDARILAEQMHDDLSKAMMRRIAEDYEKLAKRASLRASGDSKTA